MKGKGCPFRPEAPCGEWCALYGLTGCTLGGLGYLGLIVDELANIAQSLRIISEEEKAEE